MFHNSNIRRAAGLAKPSEIVPIGKIVEMGGGRIPVLAPADLGRAIRDARRKQSLTLVLCAAANGVSVRFLSELERGKPGAAVGAALKIARSVGLRIFAEEVG